MLLTLKTDTHLKKEKERQREELISSIYLKFLNKKSSDVKKQRSLQ